MKVFHICMAGILTALVATSAAAQDLGAFEFGAFGQASFFDKSLSLRQGSGGGGLRLGFFVGPKIELEAEGAFVPTDGPNDQHIYYVPLHGRVLLNLPVDEHSAFLLGGGYVRNEYRHDAAFHDNGITGLVGFRLGLPGVTSIRLASYVDYIPSPSNGAGYHLNWGIQTGLSFRFGKRSVTQTEHRAAVPRETHADSLAMAARADSLARAALADSLRLRATQDSLAQAAKAEQDRLRDSVQLVEQKANARQQALRDSLRLATIADSVHTAALRDSLRLTRNRARMASIRDSLARAALRDSLRLLLTVRATRVTLRGVNFELGKAVLLPVSKDILRDVAASLITNPDVRVEVAGHTDSTGPRALNERLSLARAESVKAFLIENGVAADRMEVHGYASEQPVATNKTASGRAQNRRVELRRID